MSFCRGAGDPQGEVWAGRSWMWSRRNAPNFTSGAIGCPLQKSATKRVGSSAIKGHESLSLLDSPI
jgi:hypothetical protein